MLNSRLSHTAGSVSDGGGSNAAVAQHPACRDFTGQGGSEVGNFGFTIDWQNDVDERNRDMRLAIERRSEAAGGRLPFNRESSTGNEIGDSQAAG
jgi:hypothetical protein